MHTRSANLGAYQTEKQAEVGVAGAQALGQMGANGAGNINLGDGGAGGGFNPASMMASIALGGVVGKTVANTIETAINGINQPMQTGAMPPPIPTVAYHVAVNGQATGPYDLTVLLQMTSAGQFNSDSLVWKNGMAEWVKAGTVDELKKLFTNAMPPVPPT